MGFFFELDELVWYTKPYEPVQARVVDRYPAGGRHMFNRYRIALKSGRPRIVNGYSLTKLGEWSPKQE